jgi:hypothetical protein
MIKNYHQEVERAYPLSEWPELYADYLNNFLTVERFTEHYSLTLTQASEIIATGKLTDNYSKEYRF